MLHRFVLASFGLLTLATCNNQKLSSEKNNDKTKSTETVTVTPKTKSTETTSVTPSPKKTEPEMSDGLPPDKAAVEQAKKEAAQATANKQGVIYLKEGENKFLEQYQMNVTFKQMSEDSRCPKDVNCIWAGVATADVEFMGTATRPRVLQLSTMDDSNKGYAKTQNFNNYNITLVSVSPETTSDKGFKALKGSYKIGLKFERGNSADGTTTR